MTGREERMSHDEGKRVYRQIIARCFGGLPSEHEGGVPSPLDWYLYQAEPYCRRVMYRRGRPGKVADELRGVQGREDHWLVAEAKPRSCPTTGCLQIVTCHCENIYMCVCVCRKETYV